MIQRWLARMPVTLVLALGLFAFVTVAGCADEGEEKSPTGDIVDTVHPLPDVAPDVTPDVAPDTEPDTPAPPDVTPDTERDTAEPGDAVDGADVPPEVIEEPYDEIPLEPTAGFRARQADSLQRCHDEAGSGGGIYGQVCRVVLGAETYNEGAFDEALNRLDQRLDTADFRLAGLVRLLYLDRTHGSLPDELRDRVTSSILGFKYWLDEPGKDKMCYWTENHQALFFSGALLAGQLFPDEVFSNSGMTGSEHVAKVHPRVLRWLHERMRFGFSEWHSNIYFNEDIPALLNLIDFAEDPEIRTKAAMILDLLSFDMLNNSYRGAMATVFGRTSPSKFLNGLSDSSAPAAWVILGIGEPHSPTNFGAAFAATSINYHPPALLEDIAAATTERHEHRQRDGLDVVDGPRYGIGYEGEQDIVFWSGMAASVAPEVIDGTMAFLEEFDLWEGFLFGDLPADIRDLLQGFVGTPQLRRFAESLRPISQGIGLESMSTYVYRTPHYQLGGAQDHKPGFFGAQTLMWMAALDHEALVTTTSPVDIEGGGVDEIQLSFAGPWVGGWKPRGTLHRNVGVFQYRKPNVPVADPFISSSITHAFFPRARFDEVREEGPWVFGRKNGGYVALASKAPTYWAEDNDYELIADGTENIWIVELGSEEEWADFDAFVAAVAGATLDFEAGVSYDSPSLGLVEVDWQGPFIVDGQEIPLGPYERWDNAFCRQEFGTERAVIEHEGVRLDLDMAVGTRRLLVRRESDAR